MSKDYKVTPPTHDPTKVYPQVPGIDYDNFKLSSERIPEDKRQLALNQLKNYENKQLGNFLGYQANQKLDYASELSEYLNCQVNNIGDPFVSGNFTVNCKFAERAVLDYFASLWNAQWPHLDRNLIGSDWTNSYWGYVTSMGCTEANVYGLWNARDYLAGKFILLDPESKERARLASLSGRPTAVEPQHFYYQAKAAEDKPNEYTPIAFYSQDTHYSIIKAMRVLTISTFNEAGSGIYKSPLKYPEDYPEGYSSHYIDKNDWPLEVPSDNDGRIYIPALKKLVEFFARLGHPILVNFNVGTTFKGTYDQVDLAISELVPILKTYGLYEREVIYDPATGKSDTRTGFWFHVDGALGAAYLYHLKQQDPSADVPSFDFSNGDLQSISMSGHKWIGAPWPCGIYMTKVKYQLQPPDDPMYLGSPDSTFAGSRNGFSSLILWDYFSKHSFADEIAKIKTGEENAAFAFNLLQEVGNEIGKDIWVERSPYALTIRFMRPNPEIVYKYSLSGEELYVNGEKRLYSHIYIMESADRDKIKSLIVDLRQGGAFPDQNLYPDEFNGIDPAEPDGKRGVFIPQSGRGFK